MADIIGAPDLHIEAKRTERVNIYKAIEQAESSIAKTHSPDVPIVITRKNRVPTEESLCVLRLKDFVDLYRTYLQVFGYIKQPKGESDES